MQLCSYLDLPGAGQSLDSASAVSKAKYKQTQEEESDARPKPTEPLISLSSSASTSSTGVHKQKSFDHIEILSSEADKLPVENTTQIANATNITAYREVSYLDKGTYNS